MKKIIIGIIDFYQHFLSPDQGKISRFFGKQKTVCMYYPTCSEYMKQAVQKYGVIKGVYLGIKRIGRCNPTQTARVDLVP